MSSVLVSHAAARTRDSNRQCSTALGFDSGIPEMNERGVRARACARVARRSVLCATRDVRRSEARVKIDLVTSGART